MSTKLKAVVIKNAEMTKAEVIDAEIDREVYDYLSCHPTPKGRSTNPFDYDDDDDGFFGDND